MNLTLPAAKALAATITIAVILLVLSVYVLSTRVNAVAVESRHRETAQQSPSPITPPVMTSPPGAAKVEQVAQGPRPGATLVASFDGLGVGFAGPHGTANLRNPSDNSLAVGPNHIFQIVNTRMAIYAKKGKQFDATGKVLYGPVPTNTIFKGFGGACEAINNGDAVVRYDQLANRWLVVMPTFRRGAVRPDQPQPGRSSDPAQASVPGKPDQPGEPVRLFSPPAQLGQPPQPRGQPAPPGPQGPYSMCYAVSVGADPFGPYYRYEFLRALFPDYPRPAIWPDGYYIPTSTGANFLNNADIDGQGLPPAGAPNIMMAAGGTQLKQILEDDGIFVWKFHVDWKHPANTKITGPEKIAVAPYHYLCDGQLTNCVPQPGTDRRLDAQGDKIMARLVYRKIGKRESIVAVHSVNTSAGGGGVRWYEFRINKDRNVSLYQQGTYAPDRFYRWMASPAMDRFGNIGIGYSFGGTPNFAGQRFAGRLAKDKLGQLTLHETVLVEGKGVQTNTLRWEDYTQTAVDPSDDCTIWYVGDYLQKDAANYSSRIGAFRMPGCRGGR